MTFIFYILRISPFPFIKRLDHFRTSPLPAPGRGVPSLRGGVREHDTFQKVCKAKNSFTEKQ